jgi:hypothetical protein
VSNTPIQPSQEADDMPHEIPRSVIAMAVATSLQLQNHNQQQQPHYRHLYHHHDNDDGGENEDVKNFLEDHL